MLLCHDAYFILYIISSLAPMKTPIIIGIKIALDVWINLRRYVYKTVLKISEQVYFGAFFCFSL